LDPASLAAAFVGAQTGQLQMTAAAKMMKMNANQAASIAQLLEAATENITSLANVASGIGQNLNVTA
jgi:hypothetical protein